MSDGSPRIAKYLTPGRAVLLALGVLLLAFALACYLTGARFAAEVEKLKRRGEPVRVSELLPKIALGQQNAAEVYEQAFAVAPSSQDIASVSVYPGQWNPQQEADAARLVATHRDYYELLDEASLVRVCAPPMERDAGSLMHPSYRDRMRDAGTALAIEARLQGLGGDLDGAARTCGTLLRLAEHRRQSPMLDDLMYSAHDRGLAIWGLPRLLAIGDPSPAACRMLDAELAKPNWQAASIRVLQAERADGLAGFARVERGSLSRAFGGGSSNDWQMAAAALIGRPWWNLAKVDYMQMMARQIEALSQPSAEGNGGPPTVDGRRPNASTDATPSTSQVRKSVAHLHLRAARSAAEDGAARVALALTVYHHDHGGYPAALAELARAGWKLPLDPFTQKPYHYRREGKGFTVWSVGPDLTDNHATAYDPATFREDQPGYDFVFRCER